MDNDTTEIPPVKVAALGGNEWAEQQFVRGSEGSFGYDLRTTESVALAPGETKLIMTKVKLNRDLPVFEDGAGILMQIVPRSSWAMKGIIVANSPGIIDSDYTGEIGVLLHKLYSPDAARTVIPAGTRVAQAIFVLGIVPQIVFEKESSEARPQREGFGSTGDS